MTIFHKFTRITLIYKVTATILNTSSQYVHSVNKMHGVLVLLFFTHKAQKDLGKKFKQGRFQIVGNVIRNVCPFSQLLVFYSDRNIRVKADTLFCANSSGEVFSTPVLKENPKKPNIILGLPWLFCFSKDSSDMSRLEMIPFTGAL